MLEFALLVASGFTAGWLLRGVVCNRRIRAIQTSWQRRAELIRFELEGRMAARADPEPAAADDLAAGARNDDRRAAGMGVGARRPSHTQRPANWTAASLVAGLAMLVPPAAGAARAQVAVGPQIGVGTETDFGIGGRVLGDLGTSNLEAVGSFDIYFPEGDLDFWEINGNLFYRFVLRDTDAVFPYLGGGLNLSHLSNGDGDTEPGLNLGGGLRFATTSDASPFVELRGVIGDFDQFVVTIGALFGDTAP